MTLGEQDIELERLRREREGLVAALGKIAAGPNDAPHAEPWGKAEAMIALGRVGEHTMRGGDGG